MVLEEITEIDMLENDRVECKRVLNREEPVNWLKTVAGFANATGGKLFIGVEDKTNKLIGFDREAVDEERNYFNNQVNEHLYPRPTYKISFLKYVIKNKERYVLQITVSESENKPVILKYKGVPSIYMRREGFTNGATYEEIINMSLQAKKTQFDIVQSNEIYRKEDFQDLNAYYEKHNDGKTLPEKALQSMGFYNKDKHLANGAILFKDNYDGEKTMVQCSVFTGFNRGSDRIVSINKYKGNITSSIDYMLEYIEQRMNHSIIKQEDTRINIDAYPKRALVEGIINAVAHRDYFLDGTQIQIDMFRDRLEISSPGSFLDGGNKYGKIYDLSGIISKRRNELISSVLVICNVMEAAGTGFDKITEEYKDADDAHKPYINLGSSYFTLVLPDLTYQDGIRDNLVPNLSFVPVPNSTKYDKKVLEFCYTAKHKSSEISEYLGLSDSTYFRNKVLKNLVDEGYLKKYKDKNVVYYLTNKEMVRVD